MNWTFRIVATIALLTLAAGILAVMRPSAIDVDVATALRAPLTQTVLDDGRARIREKYVVSAPVTGTLARIEWREGDAIEPGAVLARLLPLARPLLDPESRKAAEQRLASAGDAALQAHATVERAKALRDQAGAELARSEALSKHGTVSIAELDQTRVGMRTREAELASAHFAANVAEHQIAEARAALARFMPGASKSEQFEVTSPVRGRVLHVLRTSEGVITAGTPLIEVGDPLALELVADVLSQDAIALRAGMAARVLHWGGPSELAARVRRIEPAAFTKVSALGVEEQRVNVLLDLEGHAESWSLLGDGFGVELEITTWSKPDVLQVPTSALFRDGDAWAVFIVDDEHARLKRVVPGHRAPLQTEIVSGLTPGSMTVIHPGAAVRDGVRVTHR